MPNIVLCAIWFAIACIQYLSFHLMPDKNILLFVAAILSTVVSGMYFYQHAKEPTS